mgnify:CR=1 FL=1
MGQKTNPIGNRLGFIKGWDSNWYGGKDYSAKLVEDEKIRKYLNVRLQKASISKIIIERTLKLITLKIYHIFKNYFLKNMFFKIQVLGLLAHLSTYITILTLDAY